MQAYLQSILTKHYWLYFQILSFFSLYCYYSMYLELIKILKIVHVVHTSTGEAKNVRQAGGHQSAPQGRDGSLQENDGETEREQTSVPEGEGGHAGGGRPCVLLP